MRDQDIDPVHRVFQRERSPEAAGGRNPRGWGISEEMGREVTAVNPLQPVAPPKSSPASPISPQAAVSLIQASLLPSDAQGRTRTPWAMLWGLWGRGISRKDIR